MMVLLSKPSSLTWIYLSFSKEKPPQNGWPIEILQNKLNIELISQIFDFYVYLIQQEVQKARILKVRKIKTL